MTKYVYSFGAGKAEGSSLMRNLLGGKGCELAEMTNLGIPVPPGFTVTTEAWAQYTQGGRTLPDGLWDQVREHLARLERRIREWPGSGPVHLVGHSMGGLLAIECARAHPELPIGRILCLGSPLAGSSTAAGVAARGPLGRVLGRAVHLLRAKQQVVEGKLEERFDGFDGPANLGLGLHRAMEMDGLKA